MIDKKIESDIKAVEGFFEFWMKFHSLYKDTVSRSIISEDDEHKFLETKTVIKGKYDNLRGSFEFKYMPLSRLTDPVNDILDLGTIRLISEKNMQKMEDDWKDSYVFLNNILERLKSRKRRFEQFNPLGVFFKRVLERR